MTDETKALVVLLMTLFLINVMIYEFTKLGIGINCPDIDISYNKTNQSIGFNDILDLASGRCDGLPLIIVLLIELPLLAALFFFVRKFIGFT